MFHLSIINKNIINTFGASENPKEIVVMAVSKVNGQSAQIQAEVVNVGRRHPVRVRFNYPRHHAKATRIKFGMPYCAKRIPHSLELYAHPRSSNNPTIKQPNPGYKIITNIHEVV